MNRIAKDIQEMRIGDELRKKELGNLASLMKGKVRLMKVTYTFQDESGSDFDVACLHKDYEEPDTADRQGD